MTTGAIPDHFDVILIGSGLGATAAARLLARAGKRVGVIPGAGQPRSLQTEAGLIDAAVLEDTFGSGAPLGLSVAWSQRFEARDVNSELHSGPVEQMAPRQAYRRHELEAWAREQAIVAGATYVHGFVEGQVVPQPNSLRLSDEDNERYFTASTIALCEGSDPRIAMRVGLRPDYPPEEQVHFARAIIAYPQASAMYRYGKTRTGWGMPVSVEIVPLGATTMVSVATRIENVMRGTKSTQEALLELLSSPMGKALGVQGERLHTGIELTALRSDTGNLRLSHDRLLVGIDASGMLDPREMRRGESALQGGRHLASYLEHAHESSWDEYAMPALRRMKAENPHWYDSRATGFIEDRERDPGLVESISRVSKSIRNRLQRRG